MRIKFAVIVAVGLATGLTWFYFAGEAPRGLADAEDTPEAGTTQAFASRKASPENPSRGRAAANRKAGRKGGRMATRARSRSRNNEGAPRRSEPAKKSPTVTALDSSGVNVAEAARGSENIARAKQLLDRLRDVSPKTPGADPIDPTDLGLGPEDVGLLDLDGDKKISEWELYRSEQLLDWAERHAAQTDLGDGAYPVDREDYKRSTWEFDGVDANNDGLMDADEYHAFLVEADKVTMRLDTDGNWNISPEESGLSTDGFAEIDRNSSGYLQRWEIRRAIAQGTLD